VTSRRIAVTPHHLASQAAIGVMAHGGNAVDGAIAANATLGVVAPETCGIGGDLFALVYSPGSEIPDALNASGRAGAAASAASVRNEGYQSIPIRSPWAVTVPGCVDGWEALAARHGTLPLGQSLQRAIELATDGFAATPELAGALSRFKDVLIGQDSARGLYPADAPPRAGDLVSRPDLAGTLAAIAASGRDAFYAGVVGSQLTAVTGGILQAADLDGIQAEWIKAISLDIMGWTGWTIPPNSQGYLTLAAAWILEQLDPPRDLENPLFTHAAIEAFRSVAWERHDLVADADHAPLPPQQLLDPARLRQRVDQISMQACGSWPSPDPAPGGTAFLCVRDSAGMGVSLIQSNFHGIGSGIGVGTAGFFLHDRGSGFCLTPGHPNELAPGKRPLHTLSPSLWTKGDSLAMLLGTRGGDYQPQLLHQMLAAMRWAGADGREAQQMPRWTTGHGPSGAATIAHEPHLAPGVVETLRGLGHSMDVAPGWMGGWGPVSVITGAGERVIGAADPRVASTAALSS
jgi:gamma-glutamyltranspeptidase/glutathione hydrolase